MRPSLRTTISSTLPSVLSRWEITITVRPTTRVSTARITSTSASTSRAAVGSSRIRIGASRRMARAIANRCRWPPEKFLPCSLTSVSYPYGRSMIVSCMCACFAAAIMSASLAPGRPISIFSRIVPSKSTESCKTMLTLSRSTLSGYIRLSTPSTLTEPCWIS